MSIDSAVGVGTSWLHRIPAGGKLLGLVIGSIFLVALRSPLTIAVGAAIILTLYAVSGVGLRGLWRQVAPVRWFVAFLVPFHLWALGWQGMVENVGIMVIGVAAAGLVTETTRLTEMMAALVAAMRPLRVVGVDPDRVALVLALTLRAVPVISHIASESLDARRARGQERSIRALVTPVVIRTINHAERTGEALTARGFDD